MSEHIPADLITRDAAAPAIAAARRGWAVFPCRPGDKRPAVDKWEQRACADAERVARYWPPDSNIGIACGPSRLVVLDLDAHGQLPVDWQFPGVTDGSDVLALLCEWAAQPWPSTYLVATPSGGRHLYFTAPDNAVIRNSAGKLGPQIDVRACGGYVIGAGSVVNGKRYEPVDDAEPVPLPAWLHRMLTGPRQTPEFDRRNGEHDPGARMRGLLATVTAAPEGQRNQSLHWASCRAREMVAAGQTDAVAVVEALVIAARSAGLGEAEARRTITSGMNGAAR